MVFVVLISPHFLMSADVAW